MPVLQKYLQPSKESVLSPYLDVETFNLGREIDEQKRGQEEIKRLKEFKLKPDVDPALQIQLAKKGRAEEITGLKPDKPFSKFISSPFWAGVGDVAETAGKAASYFGAKIEGEDFFEKTGEKLKQFGGEVAEAFTDKEKLEQLGDFSWDDLLEPSFYHQKVFRGLPFALSLAPAAIAGGYALSGAAGAVGMGALGKFVLGSLGATALSRPLESAMEAGSTYDEAISKGMSQEEAAEAADGVFKKNLALSGMDFAEFATAFLPTGKIPFLKSSKFLRTGIGRAATVGAKLAVTGAMEATEEILQEKFGREAVGEEFKLRDPATKEAGVIGGIFGVGLAGVGDVFTRIQTGIRENLSTDIQNEISKIEKEIEKQPGETPQSAQLGAMDKIVEKNPEQVKTSFGEFLHEEFKDKIKDESQEVQTSFDEFLKKEYDIGVEAEIIKPVKISEKEKRYKTIIESADAKYSGIQDVDTKKLILFDDPKTGSTLALPEDKISTENVEKSLRESRVKFGIKVDEAKISKKEKPQEPARAIKKEVAGVPTFEPIVGTGKVRESKFFKRLEKQAPELIQNISREDKTYTALENKVDIEKSAQAVLEDYDKAVKIARGEARLPEGTTAPTFLNAVMEKAREIGDTATQNSILIKLRIVATTSGQTVQAFKNIPKDSATYFASKATEARIKRVVKTKTKIVKGGKDIEVKSEVEKIIKEKRKNLSKKINKKVSETTKAQSIINSLLC